MKRIITIRRQGNSASITIPREMLADLGWKEGDDVFIESQPTEPTSYLAGMALGPKILKIAKVK